MPEIVQKKIDKIPMKKVRGFIDGKISGNPKVSKISVKKMFEYSFRIDVWGTAYVDSCVVPKNTIIKSWFVEYDGSLIEDVTIA